MNKLSISPQARKDLEDIKRYISEELDNPTAALNVVSRITGSLKRLRDTPGIGAPLSSKAPVETSFPFETDYRVLVCGNYLAFYRHENKTVFVDRILYGRRDYARIIFPELAKPDSEEG